MNDQLKTKEGNQWESAEAIVAELMEEREFNGMVKQDISKINEIGFTKWLNYRDIQTFYNRIEHAKFSGCNWKSFEEKIGSLLVDEFEDEVN